LKTAQYRWGIWCPTLSYPSISVSCLSSESCHSTLTRLTLSHLRNSSWLVRYSHCLLHTPEWQNTLCRLSKTQTSHCQSHQPKTITYDFTHFLLPSCRSWAFHSRIQSSSSYREKLGITLTLLRRGFIHWWENFRFGSVPGPFGWEFIAMCCRWVLAKLEYGSSPKSFSIV
jgi:hypothetical protein